ncbi:hypothetical protein K798_18908, partial [Salmonella enterica subsp. enterica serovar Newport str. SHSN007]
FFFFFFLIVIFFFFFFFFFEPATPCVTGRYSNQLNYRSVMFPLGTRRILRFAVSPVNAFSHLLNQLLQKSPEG